MKGLDERAEAHREKSTILGEYALELKEARARSEARQYNFHRDQSEQADLARWVTLNESQKDMMVQEAREQNRQRIARRNYNSDSD